MVAGNELTATASALALAGTAIIHWFTPSGETNEKHRKHLLPREWHSPGVLIRWNHVHPEVDSHRKECEGMILALGLRVRELNSKATPCTTVIGCSLEVLLDTVDRIVPRLSKRLKKMDSSAMFGHYAPLSKAKLSLFEGSEDLETFFTPREKGRLISYILDEEG